MPVHTKNINNFMIQLLYLVVGYRVIYFRCQYNLKELLFFIMVNKNCEQNLLRARLFFLLYHLVIVNRVDRNKFSI